MSDMRMKFNNHGVAGFFEDIPALIVVIIGIVFFVSCITASFIFYTQQQYDREDEKGEQLLEALLSYNGLKASGKKDGTFDLVKLRGMEPEILGRDIHTTLDYQLEIIDVSDYPQKENFTFLCGTLHGTESSYVELLPVNIYAVTSAGDRETRTHAALLRLTYWEGDP